MVSHQGQKVVARPLGILKPTAFVIIGHMGGEIVTAAVALLGGHSCVQRRSAVSAIAIRRRQARAPSRENATKTSSADIAHVAMPIALTRDALVASFGLLIQPGNARGSAVRTDCAVHIPVRAPQHSKAEVQGHDICFKLDKRPCVEEIGGGTAHNHLQQLVLWHGHKLW
jgi:hypothetical protein